VASTNAHSSNSSFCVALLTCSEERVRTATQAYELLECALEATCHYST
jgi:hypothetical protein